MLHELKIDVDDHMITYIRLKENSVIFIIMENYDRILLHEAVKFFTVW